MADDGRNEQEGGRVCANCGTQLPHETTNFCPSCGAAQRPNPDVPTGPPPPTPEAGRIGTEYAPGVPPPPGQSPGRSGGRSRRTILLIGGGCVVLLVLALIAFVSCIALIGSSGGGGSSSKSSSDSETPEDKAQSAVAIGESVNVGDVTWRVTDARQATRLTQQGVSKQFAKTEQGNYVIVDFDFVNNGGEPVTLDTASMTLIDSEGRKSNPNPDQFFYVPQDKQIFLENMNPGVTKHGETVFEVAPGASGFQLEVGDAKMFTDENGYIDLGF